MQNIHVYRYRNPEKVGWAGTVEPGDRSWLLFVRDGGKPALFLHRVIPEAEKKERELHPNVTGEYVPAEDWSYDTPPDPNQPVVE